MKPDEEHCRDALERYFRSLYPEGPVELTPGSNPPDYLAEIGDKEFNVEVTGIVAKVAVGGVVHEEVGLFASLTQAAKSLCAALEAQPWFSGVYAVHLEPVPNLKREISDLTDRCLAYAHETAPLASAPRLRLPFHWSIAKLSNTQPLAEYSLSASEPSWEGDIQNEIITLLRDAVARKHARTQDLPGSWILLLLDRYHAADHAQWLSAAASLDSHRFCSLFRVHPHGDCWPIAGSINIGALNEQLQPTPNCSRVPRSASSRRS
jgi:hypothetical protein